MLKTFKSENSEKNRSGVLVKRKSDVGHNLLFNYCNLLFLVLLLVVTLLCLII